MDKKMLATFGLILGGIQFLVVSTIAMCLYPGGTKVNPLTAGYSFWCNMFSDMGRTVAHNGACNTVSATLFIATMWVLAMLCVPFYLVFPSTSAFNGSEKCKKHLVIIARSLAIAASVLLALSASFPQAPIAFKPLKNSSACFDINKFTLYVMSEGQSGCTRTPMKVWELVMFTATRLMNKWNGG